MARKALTTARTYGLITLGTLIYALAFAWCYDPNQIGFGGLTGLAQILHHYVPAIPIGATVMVANIPLFLLGWKLLGGHVLISSAYAMFCSSAFIDILETAVDFAPMDRTPACVLGGVLLGTGLGTVFAQGATTGGTDLMARLLKIPFGWLPMGKLLMGIDLVVIITVALSFHSLESGIYGLIGLFLSSTVMDKILYGLDTAKVAYIISERPGEIARAIGEKLERGVTLLEGQGGWSGQDKQVLLCAFKQRQIVELKALCKGLDPDAFVIVCNAYEVLGDGFKAYKKEDI